MGESRESKAAREESAADRKLLQRAAEALAEIDRATGLAEHQADVLAALRIRLEGKERPALEDLLTAAGDVGAKRDLGDVLSGGESKSRDWPDIEDKRREWPGG
jgi:hypothetical protein